MEKNTRKVAKPHAKGRKSGPKRPNKGKGGFDTGNYTTREVKGAKGKGTYTRRNRRSEARVEVNGKRYYPAQHRMVKNQRALVAVSDSYKSPHDMQASFMKLTVGENDGIVNIDDHPFSAPELFKRADQFAYKEQRRIVPTDVEYQTAIRDGAMMENGRAMRSIWWRQPLPDALFCQYYDSRGMLIAIDTVTVEFINLTNQNISVKANRPFTHENNGYVDYDSQSPGTPTYWGNGFRVMGREDEFARDIPAKGKAKHTCQIDTENRNSFPVKGITQQKVPGAGLQNFATSRLLDYVVTCEPINQYTDLVYADDDEILEVKVVVHYRVTNSNPEWTQEGYPTKVEIVKGIVLEPDTVFSITGKNDYREFHMIDMNLYKIPPPTANLHVGANKTLCTSEGYYNVQGDFNTVVCYEKRGQAFLFARSTDGIWRSIPSPSSENKSPPEGLKLVAIECTELDPDTVIAMQLAAATAWQRFVKGITKVVSIAAGAVKLLALI